MLIIFDIGIATLNGSFILAGSEKLRETSKSVALKFNRSPSDEKRTQDQIGRVDRLGTTLFKFFKASIKMLLLISKFIIKSINKTYHIKTKTYYYFRIKTHN